MQIDGLVFERTPQPLDKDVGHAPAPAVHRDLDAGGLQAPGEGAARELAALVGVEDLRRAMAGQRVVEGFDAEARVEGVRQPPGQHMPACPVHDRYEVQAPAAHWDVGDVSAPDLAPGRIEVRFASAKEAVVRLFALAQALTNDYERFETIVGKGERSG